MSQSIPPEAQKAEEPRTSQDVSLRFLWVALVKNWVLVVAIAAAVGLVATFYTLGKTKIYSSNSTILIDPDPPRPLGKDVQSVIEMGASNYFSNKEYFATQLKIIESRSVTTATVRTLGLHRDGAFIANLPSGKTAAPADIQVDVAANILRARLRVEPEKSSRLVTLYYEDADPARAQRILSTLIDTYIQQNLESTLASTNSASDWLHGQLGGLKEELENSEMELHRYKRKKDILSVSIDDQSNMLREEMQMLNQELTHVRAEREKLAARHAGLRKIDDEDPVNLPATELLQSQLLGNLRTEYVRTKSQEESLRGAGKGRNHPQVQGASAEVETARAALLAEVRNIKGAVARDLAVLDRQATALATLNEQAKQRALELNRLEIEYKRLERSKNNTEKLYALVLERSKESDLTGMMRFNNIRVVDRALEPRSPVRPNVPVNIAIGIIGGLVLGIGAALGRELLDRSIKTPDDVESELGAGFLGLLPMIADNSTRRSRKKQKKDPRYDPNVDFEPELVVHAQPMSGVAEAARAIRTNVLFMAPDEPYRCLLVTSAGPAEGKTTVACSIAIAMAQAGQRVLLMDCDLRRPRLHRVFRRHNDVGLTSAVIDREVLQGLDLSTEVDNLDMLPSGPHAPNPAELLNSESFGRLLSELTRKYDRVVIDSPPVVPVTDAAVLSTRTDGTILVVRAFKTGRDLARQAARILRDVGGRMVGTVLNAVDLSRSEYDYYHYYYYKHEGYGNSPPSDSRARDSN